MSNKLCGGVTGPQNIFNLTQYDGCTYFFAKSPLAEADGWLILCLFTVIETGVVSLLSFLRKRLSSADSQKAELANKSEFFVTAGRSLKTGVVANAIVGQWTWAATLLQSCTVGWDYGISGPFWYAAGATVPLFAFAVIAFNVKARAPQAHTLLEVVRARWGYTAHKVFFFFAITTNVIVTSMELLGGASVLNALTGVNRNAACMLIPVGVIIKTVTGGLSQTYVSSLLGSWLIMIVVLVFAFRVYATGDDGLLLGSPAAVWDNLNTYASTPAPENPSPEVKDMKLGPISGNLEGSYMTIYSQGGLSFALINAIGNFGAVWCDQSYFTAAVAASSSASWKSYLLAGALWFSIPFSIATAIGLAARAIALPLSGTEASEGLVAPAVAYHFMGNSGSFLVAVIILFSTATTAQQELIAVSKIISYDLYKTYINIKATDVQILKVTRITILCFGLFMGVLGIVLSTFGVTLEFVYLFMGIAVGGAAVPIYFCLNWDKASANGAIAGVIAGFISGLVSWIVTAKVEGGSVNKETLLGDLNRLPMLLGNLAALAVSGLVCCIVSWRNPQNYNWISMQNLDINLIESPAISTPIANASEPPHPHDEHQGGGNSPAMPTTASAAEAVQREEKVVCYASWGLVVILHVIIPLLVLPAGVFSKSYFYFWSILSIISILVACIVAIATPLLDYRDFLISVLKKLFSKRPETGANLVVFEERTAA